MANDYRQLAEGAVTNIVAYLEANLSAALDTVEAYVSGTGTNINVGIPTPAEYFVYPKPEGYALPAIFVIADQIDFQIAQAKANFVDARVDINVSVWCEEQDMERLTYMCWRYQSALHQVLDQAQIVTSDGKLKLIPVVYRAKFSDTYARPDGSTEGAQFRKEVVLQCQVTHLENY